MTDPRTSSDFFDTWLMAEAADHDAIRVKKVYIDINEGNLIDGVMFSQIMYWHGVNRETGKPRMTIIKDKHRWLAREYNEWYEECRVNYETARASIGRMVKRGLLIKKVYRFNGMATCHIRINPQAFEAAIKVAQNISSETAINRKPRKSTKTSADCDTVPLRNSIQSQSGVVSNRKPLTDTTAETTAIEDSAIVATARLQSDPLSDDFEAQHFNPDDEKKLKAFQKLQEANQRLKTPDHLAQLGNMLPSVQAFGAAVEPAATFQEKIDVVVPPIPEQTPPEVPLKGSPAFFIHHGKTAVGPFKGYKTANDYKFAHSLPGTITQGQVLPPDTAIEAPETKVSKPDALFTWIAQTIIKNDPQTAYDSKRIQAFVFNLMAPIVNAEKRRLNLKTLPPQDRDRVAGELVGFMPWYSQQCQGCPPPQDLTKFEKWINQWFAAGKPGSKAPNGKSKADPNCGKCHGSGIETVEDARGYRISNECSCVQEAHHGHSSS